MKFRGSDPPLHFEETQIPGILQSGVRSLGLEILRGYFSKGCILIFEKELFWMS